MRSAVVVGRDIQARGLRPDVVTCNAVISACGWEERRAAIGEGIVVVRREVQSHGLTFTPNTISYVQRRLILATPDKITNDATLSAEGAGVGEGDVVGV